MNKYTLMLKLKGWLVKDALFHWGISVDTWQRWRKQDKKRCMLEDMINGLEDKNCD